MKEAIFEDRGYFWWHGTPVPDRHFAPEDAVTGLLVGFHVIMYPFVAGHCFVLGT